jgi:hypothetical protein
LVTILLIYKVQKFNNIYPILSDFNDIPILINVRQKLKKNAQYIFYLYIFISWKKRGAVHQIYFRSFTHINGFQMNIWQLILIRSQIIMKLFMWSKLMKYYFKKIYMRVFISVFQIWFNVYLPTSYMTRFGLWIFMSKITHDFWLWDEHLIFVCEPVY